MAAMVAMAASLDIPFRTRFQFRAPFGRCCRPRFTQHSFQNPFPVHDGRATFCTWATFTRHSFRQPFPARACRSPATHRPRPSLDTPSSSRSQELITVALAKSNYPSLNIPSSARRLHSTFLPAAVCAARFTRHSFQCPFPCGRRRRSTRSTLHSTFLPVPVSISPQSSRSTGSLSFTQHSFQ